MLFRRLASGQRKNTAELYFADVRRRAKAAKRVEEIRNAIKVSGRWHDVEEWRISTTLEASVEPVRSHGKDWYLVRVACDNEFSCHTATIDRAAEFVEIYRRLIIDMFYNLGWPSGDPIEGR
jgi:hypothetical protein